MLSFWKKDDPFEDEDEINDQMRIMNKLDCIIPDKNPESQISHIFSSGIGLVDVEMIGEINYVKSFFILDMHTENKMIIQSLD